jgi:hypothetical protein
MMSIQSSLHLCKPSAENKIAFMDEAPPIVIRTRHAKILFPLYLSDTKWQKPIYPTGLGSR